MSSFDQTIFDGVWIELEWDTDSGFSNPTPLPEEKDIGLFPDDGFASSTRRITNLPSDTEIFVRATATALNWEEDGTYNDAFLSSGFQNDYDDAGKPGSAFNVEN